jgi:adenylate cyclase
MTATRVSGIDTILFTDLVGFTEFTDAEGDRAAVDVLDRQSHLVHQALADSDGRVVKELGDGLMLWFPAAGPAVDVAAGIRNDLEAERAAWRFPLALRMGMHAGDVVARGSDFIGQTVNVASRIADLAGPGELLVSEQVLGALGESALALRFSPVGPTRVKGVTAPIWLHRFVPEVSVD